MLIIAASSSKWDDESNGEIYTERSADAEKEYQDQPDDVTSPVCDVIRSSPLYVVENGKEYRLVSLHERMQVRRDQS